MKFTIIIIIIIIIIIRGVPVDIPEGFKSGETLIDSLKEDTT